MKMNLTNPKSLLAVAVCAAVAACGGGGSDPSSPEYQAFMQRHEVMEALGEAIRPLSQMSRDEMPVDEAQYLAAARSLAEYAARVLDGFDNQTIVPESRSTPDIWANWDDFTAKAEALQSAAVALAAAAESGGFAGSREMVMDTQRTCGGCHQPYRGPEPE